MYIHVYAHVSVYLHMYINIRVYACMYVYVYACICSYRAYIGVCVEAYRFTHSFFKRYSACMYTSASMNARHACACVYVQVVFMFLSIYVCIHARARVLKTCDSGEGAPHVHTPAGLLAKI